jgi:hypothetical protein
MTYYQVSTESGTFQILDEIKGEVQYYRIIDRNGKDCMQIAKKLYEESPDLVLTGVSYKPQCTMGTDMSSGKATRDMIRALLTYVVKNEKTDTPISFLDQSSFECDTMDGKHTATINLCLHNFILHGETWYQRYFGAVPIYKEDTAGMKTSNELLNAPVSMDFATFFKEATFYSSNIEWINSIRSHVSAEFEKHRTWRSFFNAVFDRNSQYVCNLFLEFKPFIVKQFIRFPCEELHMEIPSETIQQYPEYTALDFHANTNPAHKKKVVNTSNAILHLEGLNYNNMSNLSSIPNTMNTELYNNHIGGSRKQKHNIQKQYKTYQLFMSTQKGRPSKPRTRKRRH